MEISAALKPAAPPADALRRAVTRREVILVGIIFSILSLSPHAQTQQQGGHPGRLFPPSDLGLLDAPDRDLWQRPDQIMDAMGIADASVVADIGAGSGWFTIRLARRVGPQGLVYAEDVQKEMINAISRRVSREGLNNVQAGARTQERSAPAGGVARRGADGRCVSRDRRSRRDARRTWRAR